MADPTPGQNRKLVSGVFGLNHIGHTQRTLLRLDVVQEQADQKAAQGRNKHHRVPGKNPCGACYLFAHRAEPGPLHSTNHFAKGDGGQRRPNANQTGQQPNQRLLLAQRVSDVGRAQTKTLEKIVRNRSAMIT